MEHTPVIFAINKLNPSAVISIARLIGEAKVIVEVIPSHRDKGQFKRDCEWLEENLKAVTVNR